MGTAATPVLVLGPPRYVGPLGVMRSLGRLGVPVHGLAHRRLSVANASRYCAGSHRIGDDGRPIGDEAQLLEQLLSTGRQLGAGTILIAGSDEWAVFIAAHDAELASTFRFPRVSRSLVEGLAGKDGLYRLALTHRVPSPRIVFPTGARDATRIADELAYPVILKPVVSRPDVQTKAVVHNAAELLREYHAMEERPEAPNVMFQEYIPGGDEAVWIFNGYFDADSQCLAAFTGQKIRQHPAHMGIATLGVCRQNASVIDATTMFLSKIGYRGIVDIGYRYDRRDGQYKILDVNPRLGGAFRMFVDAHGLDVARALYLDLTGQPVPAVVPHDGRRWVKEDSDLIAVKHYRRSDGLRLRDWLRSYRGVEEGATFSVRDPLPFFLAMLRLGQETLAGRTGRWFRGDALRRRRWWPFGRRMEDIAA